MKAVKLKAPLLIGETNHAKDDVVMLPDVRAAELIRLDHAEPVDGTPAVKNPDHNPLADMIEPEPPGGLVINPIDAAAPNLNDNPGLRKAVEVAGVKVKESKVKADDVKEGPVPPAKVPPTALASEALPLKG